MSDNLPQGLRDPADTSEARQAYWEGRAESEQRTKQLEDALREQSALLDAVSPSGREGIYIKHMDYDEWLDRCDKSNAVVNELLSTGDT